MLKTLKPVDLLSIAFILFMAAVTVFAFRLIPASGWLLARYGALIIALAAAARAAASRPASAGAALVHAFLPVLVVPIMFDSMGDVIPWIWSRTFDNVLIRIDAALFGGHNPTVLLERFISPVLTTVLQFAYISYYFMAIALGAVLFGRKKRAAFDEAIFGVILCFYLSYIGYLLVPAVGPRFTLAHLQTRGLEAGPLVRAIQNTLNALENTKTDAFPSGHTAIALMTLYYAWKTKERLLAWVLLPAVTGLIVSTVYLRYHYVIDVIAGIVLALVTIAVAPWLYAWCLRLSQGPRDERHHAP